MFRTSWRLAVRRRQFFRRRADQTARRSLLRVEILEGRDVPSAVQFHPTYTRYQPPGTVSPMGFSSPVGLTPAQVRHAYGFDTVAFAGGIAGDGTGQTIAIVDAFDDPNIADDLHQFSVQFGLPDPPSFTKVSQTGSLTSLPPANAGWAGEIALDVEWAHAIAPGASILLVEARSSGTTDLYTAVDFARRQPGVSVVSMSWGGSEYFGETSDDFHFTTPAGHAGVSFVASSGDDGAPAGHPAVSPNVLAVGGTTLRLTSSNAYQSETGWGGSGGGPSRYFSQPAYQNGVVTQTTKRANPDVAYDGDPNTGFAVYDSYNEGSAAPWTSFGGTSAGAPQWAALVAIVNQGRALAGQPSLDGGSELLPAVYSLPATAFHDVTTGSSRGSPSYAAGPGYDLVTGRGSPIAPRVVAGLSGVPVAGIPTAVVPQSGTPQTARAGSAFAQPLKAVVQDAFGNPVPGVSVTFTAPASGPGGTFPGGALSAAVTTDAGGVATAPTFTANGQAGAYTVTATAAGVSNSAAFALANQAAAVTVQSFAVNGGAAQRSRVTSLTVSFSGVVTFPADPATAFRVLGPNGPVGVAVDLSGSTPGQTVARLTFTGPGVTAGSLADGRYTLTILGALIQDSSGQPVDAAGNGVPGSERTVSFYRFFGDANGDGTVDALDLFAFAGTFGKGSSDPAFNVAFDANGDGTVDALDLFAFAGNFGKTLP